MEKLNDNNGDEQEHEEMSESLSSFKKPTLLIGPRKGQHKFSKIKQAEVEEGEVEEDVTKSSNEKELPVSSESPAEALQARNNPLPYKEPKWASTPDKKYKLEVLKSGAIVETTNLEKSCFVFGRTSTVDHNMAHPSISRYHCILQFGKLEGDDKPGFYLFDLNSTHGTFLNKCKIKPNLYVRMQVGHMVKLGLSSRIFILQGPPDDIEPESELSVTEMKDLVLKKKLAKLEKTVGFDPKNDDGIDWGMGEDAEEETDLSVNPFAAAPNEELYLDDPKKTLRGWFEREGCELQYDCQEKGFGQFVCRVELPVDDPHGRSIVAEAVVKGKKKEAVVQCALEACRILDQHGLLRQSNHESRKKKTKDWEANDFYDSDEDEFLDRTGTVQRKRQRRMREAGVTPVVHTYAGLIAEHARLVDEAQKLELELSEASKPVPNVTESQEDELDQYMAGLVAEGPGKIKISSLKVELNRIKQEEARVRALANIARSAGTEELKCPWPESEPLPTTSKPKALPMIGKRRGLLKKPERSQVAVQIQKSIPNDEEEFDSD